MKKLLVLMILFLAACGTSTTPDPVPSPVAAAPTCSVVVTVNGDGSVVVNGCGNVVTVTPSPSPIGGGPFPKPDYVKITQFGESCPSGIEPSGQDRSVKIGCTKALTLSPKCRQPNGPDIDCPVPDNAAPDEFKCSLGCDHIGFASFGSIKSLSDLRAIYSLFNGPHSMTDAFNRLATGRTEGAATITGSYAGIKVQDDFVLTVVK